MIPLTKILRKAKAGYTLDDIKVNHLLFMDDLKLFAKNEKLLDRLVVFSLQPWYSNGSWFKEVRGDSIQEGEAEKDSGLIQLVNGETIKEVG